MLLTSLLYTAAFESLSKEPSCQVTHGCVGLHIGKIEAISFLCPLSLPTQDKLFTTMAPTRSMKAILDRLTILEGVVAEQGRKIQRLQRTKASLRNRLSNRSTRGSPSFLLPEDPRNNPEDRAAASNSAVDSTGSIFWNSFEASLSRISAGGDIDLSAVLHVLRNEAFGHVKAWRPIKPEIVRHKSKLIKAILSPNHIHMFKDDQRIFTVGQNSVWPSIVDEVFPEARGNRALRTSLINYCMKSAKGTGFFGQFAAAVVQAHRMHCQRCRPLD